jgi:multidrug efflux pump subunit AcrB
MPLREAATVITGNSYTEINRRNGRRIITVSADVDELVSNSNQIIAEIIEYDMPQLAAKYPGLIYSFGGEREAQNESIGALGIGFLVSMLGIFTLLAVPFRSYIQPIIVMLSIPFGFIGAVLGHLLLGYNLSIVSMFGLIALSGVVVNDSLVLVVTANRFRREENLSAEQAVKRAGVRRFRSVTLTSLTTFFGLNLEFYLQPLLHLQSCHLSI